MIFTVTVQTKPPQVFQIDLDKENNQCLIFCTTPCWYLLTFTTEVWLHTLMTGQVATEFWTREGNT